MEITINQNENQLISISNNNLQDININESENQLININNNDSQNLGINQPQAQTILIDGGGVVIGISDVLVNGVSVVSGNIAYVIVPTKTSELTNDSGFLTHETDPTVPTYIKQISLADIASWNNKQNELVSGSTIKTINNESLLGSGNIVITGTQYEAGTGINISNDIISNTITSYEDLEDLPTIPTKTSDLLNDNNFVESSQLADVAFSGDYNDLNNLPSIPQNTSDLVNDGEDGTHPFISNYNPSIDLVLKSQISGGEATLDFGVPNSGGTAYVYNTLQNELVSGTNIKTINNESLLGSGNITISSGSATDVQINGTSIVTNNVADIITESAYNPSTNKIATINDLPQRNIINAKPSADVTLTAGIYNDINNLIATNTVGNGLTISNGKIKIGSGITNIKVTTTIGINATDMIYSYLTKNSYNDGNWVITYSNIYGSITRNDFISVNENDLISFNIYAANGGTIANDRTNIIIESI